MTEAVVDAGTNGIEFMIETTGRKNLDEICLEPRAYAVRVYPA